jgi:hypothetical protein
LTMTSYVYPPVQLSSVPVGIENPDGSQAQLNFAQTEVGTVTSTATFSAAPVTIKTLTATMRKVIVKNDSGNNLLMTIGARPGIVIPKGADNDELDAYGLSGEDVDITTQGGGAGSAGELIVNYLG